MLHNIYGSLFLPHNNNTNYAMGKLYLTKSLHEKLITNMRFKKSKNDEKNSHNT